MEGGGWYSLQAPSLFAYHTAPVHFRAALDTHGRASSGFVDDASTTTNW